MFYIFGGASQDKKQVSRLNGCTLERIRSLDFDHQLGSCLNIGERRLYLCFNDNDADRRRCRVSNGPEEEFNASTSSLYNHKWIKATSSNSNIGFDYL